MITIKIRVEAVDLAYQIGTEHRETQHTFLGLSSQVNPTPWHLGHICRLYPPMKCTVVMQAVDVETFPRTHEGIQQRRQKLDP